jgi:CubicO group peptidase (beta-lactamase class C family)
MMLRILLLLLALSPPALVAMSATSPSETVRNVCRSDPRLAAAVDKLFADVSNDQPGFALGIIADGCLAVAGGYGLADLDTREPISRHTAFNLASL